MPAGESASSSQGSVQVFADSAKLVDAAAEEFVRCREAAIRTRGRFAVALSGGSTPKALNRKLARDHPEAAFWKDVHLFLGDERAVPPEHPESNFRMTKETLFSAAKVPAQNIHRIAAELPPQEAAEKYEQELRQFFALKEGQWPRFDLIFLGMGPDGHTASLFPHSKALEERSRLVVANWVEKFSTWRITVTLPVLNHAREVIFLVTGAEKAPMIAHVLGDARAPETLPSQLVAPANGRLIWMLDEAAASALSRL